MNPDNPNFRTPEEEARAAEFVRMKAEVERQARVIEKLREHLNLALSFAPKGPVPEGLAPMFYHTLDYKSEIELQARIDEARKAIEQQGEGT